MNFDIIYKEKISNIDSYLLKHLSTYSKASDKIVESMKYSVLNGGKRLRSILCTEICNMLGGDIETAMPFACGIELIHAYSLVHDDLPAMDNADTRRGQPSCHKKYGEAMGILCGDALLNSAYELMALNCTDTYSIKAMCVLAESAGADGMISGQVKDLEVGSSHNVTEEILIDIIEKKTMAIIRSSVVSGAMLAHSDNETISKMDEFAYHLGIAFQIRDDFEDITEDVASANDSPNFINAIGRENAANLLNKHSIECKKIIAQYDNNKFMMGLLDFLF